MGFASPLPLAKQAVQCGHRTLQRIYRTEYKKEQNTRYRPMDLKNSRYLRQNSDLRPTRKAWGVDSNAACAKRDERQFSKAAQAALLSRATEERAKCSK